MATRRLDDSLIPNAQAEVLKKFGKLRLLPSLSVQATGGLGTQVHVAVTWATHLAAGSLKVKLNDQLDITGLLAIDAHAMQATGLIDAPGVGLQKVSASGEFLAQMAPMRTVILTAEAYAYIPY